MTNQYKTTHVRTFKRGRASRFKVKFHEQEHHQDGRLLSFFYIFKQFLPDDCREIRITLEVLK